MKTDTPARGGFTLVEIMIVVAIIGLLAAIAIPNFVRARNTSQKNACINNLRQIDSALKQWALENGKVDSSVAQSTDLQSYLRSNLFPHCPSGGVYGSAGNPGSTFVVSRDPLCSNQDNLGHVLPLP
jgi:prepilin-type N-terminal cleavage/methylation domain-containing protein